MSFTDQNNKENVNLLQFPNEIIAYILTFCTIKSISTLNQTCRRLQKLTNEETLWSYLCYKCKLYNVVNVNAINKTTKYITFNLLV